MLKGIIDRFEGDFAIIELEDRTMIDIKKTSIPKDAKEGMVVRIDGSKVVLDCEATAERKKEIENLMDDMWA